MLHTKSRDFFERAVKVIPGGVNSPVRAFKSVGGNPIFMARGEGAFLIDVDGNRYLDCIGSWGPLILGHAPEIVIKAIESQLSSGTTFGAPTELEVELAELVCEIMPSIEMLRMVSSGTEATMSAIRVARGYTGKKLIVKFEGNYHGHADFLLAKAGSGVATLGLPECAGVPESVTADTITLKYNDPEAVISLFKTYGESIACIIVEPVAGNMGCVVGSNSFLQTLRECCTKWGAVLIFDEVMSGFRVSLGGAQELLNVTPDMTTLGKIAGGGLPLGIYGGRREIMETVAPLGPVYQAGTLSGNPIAVVAGLNILHYLKANAETVYPKLTMLGNLCANGLRESAKARNIPVVVNNCGSMVTCFFTSSGEVTDYTTAKTSNTVRFGNWFRGMLEAGIYWPPSQFEAAFLSAAMTEADINNIIQSSDESFSSLQR